MLVVSVQLGTINQSDHCVKVAILTRVSLILADVVVIVATWVKVQSHVRSARRLRIGMRASTVVFKDGRSNSGLSRPTVVRSHRAFLQAPFILCKHIQHQLDPAVLLSELQGVILRQRFRAGI